jgi:HK97 family phage prohead protease
MERRAGNIGQCRVETRADGSKMIVGYGAVFHRADDPGTEYQLWRGAVERVGRSAFDNALKRPDDVRGLFNHDSDRVLGRTTSGTMRLSVDDRGLRYEIDLPDTQTARDVAASIERGDITGSSFSFSVEGEEWQRDDGRGVEIRTIKDVKLFDVGPVTFPAYQSANTGVRADGDTGEAERSRAIWRMKEREVNVRMRMLALDAEV